MALDQPSLLLATLICDEDLAAGAVVSVNERSIRVRRLPRYPIASNSFVKVVKW
jgi:hypothetical protein